jgi:N-glycosylase/DNA lyase
MRYDPDAVKELQSTYDNIRDHVIGRLSQFRDIWDSIDETRALHELLFCILTPQSKAQVCWSAIEAMACTDTLLNGNYEQVVDAIGNVRFKYRKAGFLIGARNRFYEDNKVELLSFLRKFSGSFETRDWLVKNIKGLGYKESSHFLRNIGLGNDLAILDRHILKNLVKVKVILEMPKSMSDRRYLQIESNMREFASEIDIPLSHLDLVMWYMATGSIFK